MPAKNWKEKKQYLQNKYHLRFVNAETVLTVYTGQLFVLFYFVFCFCFCKIEIIINSP